MTPVIVTTSRRPAANDNLARGVDARAGPRILVAKIDRADGQTTSVVAQVH